MKKTNIENLTGLWCGLFRVLEIAKTGGYSVTVHLAKDYKEGFEDYQVIKDFCRGWFEDFKSEGDINVEILKPYDYESGGRAETLINISERVKNALQFKKPEILLCSASQSLLKTACNRLGLSLKQIKKIKRIGATIAQMALSDRIKVEHIAESIQYSFIPGDYGYLAESKSKKFGEMVTVKVGEADKEDILSAIDYLSALLRPSEIQAGEDLL